MVKLQIIKEWNFSVVTLAVHSVSFSQIHSGGDDDDDARLMGG